MTAIFDALSEPVAKRVTAGLARVGQVLQTQAWRGAGSRGITPTQGKVLAFIRDAPGDVGLKAIAKHLGVSAPTASDAVNSLVTKGLAVKTRSSDKRALRLSLTLQGKNVALEADTWPEFLTAAVETLPSLEQAGFLKSLVQVIRALQVAGDIPPQAMCVTCRYFRPNVHADPTAPHQCDFVGAAFGDRHLRLNCAEHEPAPEDEQNAAWAGFFGGRSRTGAARPD